MLKKIKKRFYFIQQLRELFTRRDKIEFFFLIAAVLLMALFQTASIAAILPFIELVMNPEAVYERESLNYIYNLLGFSNVGSFIFFTGCAVLGLVIVSNVLSAFTIWYRTYFIWNKNHHLSFRLFKNYLSMPYEFFLTQHSADLGKNILAEVNHLTVQFLLPLVQCITGGIVTLAILSMLLYVDPITTLIAAGVLFVMYLAIYLYFARKFSKAGEKRLEENKYRFKIAGDALGGIKDVKIAGKEEYFANKFQGHSQKFSNLQAWYYSVNRIPRYFMEVVAFGGVIALILFLLAIDYGSGEIIPMVSFFAFAGYRLMPALQEVFNSFTSFRFNKAILDKIHADSTLGKKAGTISVEKISFEKIPFKEKIEIKDLSFSYPGTENLVLKNINIQIPKNSSVAIVGATGSGKTTLVDIILGLLTPTRGKIKVDDTVIEEKKIRNWQSSLGYVPQQIFLSDDTILANIAFGISEDNIDMKRVEEITKIANIHNFITKELPHGYKTVVGERGVRLSGGQKQRVGIARALYQDPEVLIFDEATSALDGATEKSVLQAIKRSARGKTEIVIAHRLSTIKDSDVIYFLKKGQIIDRGSFGELMEKNSLFRQMSRRREEE